MLKIVFDADALIKLAKADVLDKFTGSAYCSASRTVYEEIMKGKARSIPDAWSIEELMKAGLIHVKDTHGTEMHPGLGPGESSTLRLYRELRADWISSDDRRFTKVLRSLSIPFILPTEIVLAMVKSGRLPRPQGREALERLRPFVREDVYSEAARQLRGG